MVYLLGGGGEASPLNTPVSPSNRLGEAVYIYDSLRHYFGNSSSELPPKVKILDGTLQWWPQWRYTFTPYSSQLDDCGLGSAKIICTSNRFVAVTRCTTKVKSRTNRITVNCAHLSQALQADFDRPTVQCFIS